MKKGAFKSFPARTYPAGGGDEDRVVFEMPTETGEPFECDLSGLPVTGRKQNGRRVIVFPAPFANLEIVDGRRRVRPRPSSRP